jgi:hypothetical protein
MKTILFSLFGLALLGMPALAQSTIDPERFQPYAAGNAWEYRGGTALHVVRAERDTTADGHRWTVLSMESMTAASTNRQECMVRWDPGSETWRYEVANCTALCVIDVGPVVNPGPVVPDQEIEIGGERVLVDAIVRDSLDYWSPGRVDKYRVWYATDIGKYRCTVNGAETLLQAALIDGRMYGTPEHISLPDSALHFPLAVGNEWAYFATWHFPPAEPDTVWGPVFRIQETIAIEDTTYFLAPHPFALSDTLRLDAKGNVHARLHGRDVRLFDFGWPEGETYTVPMGADGEHEYRVSVERNLNVEVGAGRFEEAIRFRFEIDQVTDSDRIWTFAPGVGIVEAIGGHGDYEELYSAVIGGRVVSIANDAGFNPDARITFYPNPFRETVTLHAFVHSGFSPRMRLYDLLGREVATLEPEECGLEECRFKWVPGGLPAGRYFARIHHGAGVETVVLLRYR